MIQAKWGDQLTSHSYSSQWVNDFGKEGVEKSRFEFQWLLNHKDPPGHQKKSVKSGQCDQQLMEQTLFGNGWNCHQWQNVPDHTCNEIRFQILFNRVYFYATKVAGRSKSRILVTLGWVDQLMGGVHHAKYFWPESPLILIWAHPNFQVTKKN